MERPSLYPADDASKHLVVIVNRTLARRYFPAGDAIGKQIYYDGAPQQPIEIIGVIDDVKEGNLEDTDWGAMYVPNGQSPNAWPAILIRTSLAEAQLDRQISEVIHRIDPFITVSDTTTMTERIAESPSAYLHNSAAWLVGIFAVVALLLGVVGFYGVVAYWVGQRTHELA